MTGTTRRGSKLFRRLLIAVAIMALIVGIAYQVLESQDAKHARFYDTGKSVNQFLSDYSKALKEGQKLGSADFLADYVSESYRAPGRGAWSFEPRSSEADIHTSILTALGDDDFGPSELQNEMAAYLGELRQIDRLKMKIDIIEEIEPYEMVRLRVKYILDGVDRAGISFQDRIFHRWYLDNESQDEGISWRIVRDELVDGIRVARDGSGFSEVEPASIGIDYRHNRDPKLDIKGPDIQFGVIQHGLGGLAVYDYDGDDLADVFFADGIRSRLYRNLGPSEEHRIQFADVTEQAGLDGIDQATSGVFADVDNDGIDDLLVVRYLAPNRFFRGKADGSFEDVSEEMGLGFTAPAISATFLDYDLDGYLDLYFGVYGNAFEAVPRLPFFARNGGANRLFHNDGGKGFTDVTEASGTGDTGWCMAVSAADYDGDGDPDLATANDFGRKVLYRNEGDGTFTDVAKEAGVLDFSGGMGITFGDFDDDGQMDLYTSNINSNQRWFGEEMTISQYTRNVVRTKWAFLDYGEYMAIRDLLGKEWRALGLQIGEGNSLFRNEGDGTFTELNESQTRRGGWSWNAAFFDIDNDSRLDIHVANGWISATPYTDL